jgi:hypothetical protein
MASTPKIASPTPTLHESDGLQPALAPFGDAKSDPKNKGSATTSSSLRSRPSYKDRSGGEDDHNDGSRGAEDGEGSRNDDDGRGREGSGGAADDEGKKNPIQQREEEQKRKEKEKDPNEVGFDGPDDQSNPQNWSQRRKWFVQSSFQALCSYQASSI